VGGIGDCVLEVDGAEVDRVYDIWVNAGGSVTCQFFHTFRELGHHDVRIHLVPHTVRDWDPENNAAAAGTIRIDPIASSFVFNASFHDNVFDEASRGAWRVRARDGSWGYEEEYENAFAGRTQDAWMTAYLPHAVTFPLERVQARQYTRDETVQGLVLVDVPADFTWEFWDVTQSCVQRTLVREGWLELCSVRGAATEWQPEWGYTFVNFYRNAGDVTYHSRGSTRHWNRDLGYDDTWSWNYDITGAWGYFASYGFEYAFFLALIDQGVLYRTNPFVWLATSDNEVSSAWQCWTYTDEWASSEQCSEVRRTERMVGGSVYGEPWSP
jgi:hypothetical protein